jgi:hypothetical protein
MLRKTYISELVVPFGIQSIRVQRGNGEKECLQVEEEQYQL